MRNIQQYILEHPCAKELGFFRKWNKKEMAENRSMLSPAHAFGFMDGMVSEAHFIDQIMQHFAKSSDSFLKEYYVNPDDVILYLPAAECGVKNEFYAVFTKDAVWFSTKGWIKNACSKVEFKLINNVDVNYSKEERTYQMVIMANGCKVLKSREADLWKKLLEDIRDYVKK